MVSDSGGDDDDDRSSLYIEVLINHAIWSMYPIFSRYLQVKSEPQTMDVFVLLSSAKFAALLVIYFKFLLQERQLRRRKGLDCNDSCIINGNTWDRHNSRDVNNDNDNDDHNYGVIGSDLENTETIIDHTTTSDNNISHNNNDNTNNDSNTEHINNNVEELRKQKSPAQRWITRITYGVLAMGRAMFAVLAARYAEAYKLVLITLLVPLLTSIADKLFLSKDLPTIIWPTLLFSLVGAFLTSFQYDDTDLEEGHERGITYQCISVLFQVLCRLLMKLSENTLPKHEINLAGSAFTFVSSFIITLFTRPEYLWGVFLNMGVTAWFSWSFVAIMVFVVAYTSTVALIRRMGPALYSSIGGLRVVFTAAVGKLWLNEGIETVSEWVGVVLVISSITWFMYGLHKLAMQKQKQKKEQVAAEGGEITCEGICDNDGIVAAEVASVSNHDKDLHYLSSTTSTVSSRYLRGVDSLSQILDIMSDDDKENLASQGSTTTTTYPITLRRGSDIYPIIEGDSRSDDQGT